MNDKVVFVKPRRDGSNKTILTHVNKISYDF